MDQQPASTQPPPSQPAVTRERPLGITILAVLAAVGGVFGLVGALGLFAFAPLWGLISLALAVAYLAFAYGAWTLQPWGWTLGVALAAAGILWALFWFTQGQNIVSTLISLAISGVILYYLYQPDVKAAFGRS